MVSHLSIFACLILLGSSHAFDPDGSNDNEHDFMGVFEDFPELDQDDSIKKFDQDDYIAICADHKDSNVDNIPANSKCSSSILSSSLALSLLRRSSSPSESFVLSPFSLGVVLSLLNDGAEGETRKELTNLLLPGCNTDDVTNHYSSLSLSVPSKNKNTSFSSANRFYVHNSISLKEAYKHHTEKAYRVEVESINLRETAEAAETMNEFVDTVTNGEIKEIINAAGISSDAVSYLINAVFFNGLWMDEFRPFFGYNGSTRVFRGVNCDRDMDFMKIERKEHLVNAENELGTALLLPYKDSNFKFFMLMAHESESTINGTPNFRKMRDNLTGEELLEILSNARSQYVDIVVPKFEIDSELNGIETLKQLGVTNLGDLSKISDSPLQISTIIHKATIKVHEKGSIASGATAVQFLLTGRRFPSILTFDRPFLFGIVKNEAILFMGQLV